MHDPARIEFVRRHTAAVWQAIEERGDVRGYFIWSILDNFEWDLGFTMRFGLTYVDFESQKRILTDSTRWCASIIRNNTVTTDR